MGQTTIEVNLLFSLMFISFLVGIVLTLGITSWLDTKVNKKDENKDRRMPNKGRIT